VLRQRIPGGEERSSSGSGGEEFTGGGSRGVASEHGDPSLSSEHGDASLSSEQRIQPPEAVGKRIRPPEAARAWILPRTTAARGTGLGGLFYFLKLLSAAGYITQPPPIIALTEAVFATASVKATINLDL
jgi:hypothetical protein